MVLVLGIANFDSPRKITLGFPEGDIPLITADVSLWPRIRRTLFFERLDARTFVETLSAARSDLVRSRRDVRRLAASLLRPELQRSLLGRRVQPTRRLDAFAGSGANPAPPPHAQDRRLSAAERRTLKVTSGDVARALSTLRRLYPRLHEGFRGQGTRELWVWTPIAVDLLEPADLERLRSFHREATRVVEAAGGRSIDLSEAISTERFYTRAHYDEEGHRRMSRLLWPVIRDELRYAAFFVFFAVVLALFRAVPWTVGRLVLLVASYLFYGAANPWYCLLLFGSTIVDYRARWSALIKPSVSFCPARGAVPCSAVTGGRCRWRSC